MDEEAFECSEEEEGPDPRQWNEDRDEERRNETEGEGEREEDLPALLFDEEGAKGEAELGVRSLLKSLPTSVDDPVRPAGVEG